GVDADRLQLLHDHASPGLHERRPENVDGQRYAIRTDVVTVTTHSVALALDQLMCLVRAVLAEWREDFRRRIAIRLQRLVGGENEVGYRAIAAGAFIDDIHDLPPV